MPLNIDTYKNAIKSSKLFTQIKNLSTPRPSKKQWIVFAISLASLLILVNIGLMVYHQSHFYPNTQIGAVQVGGLSYDRAKTIVDEHVQHQTVRLAFDQDVKTLSPSELGANYHVDASLKAAQAIDSPLFPLLAYTPWGDKPQVDFEYNLDETVFSKKVSEILENADTQPVNAKLEIKEGQASLIPDKAGQKFNNQSISKQLREILSQLSAEPIIMQAENIPAEVSSADLSPALNQAKKMLSTKIVLSHSDIRYQPSREEIGKWLKVGTNHKIEFDEGKISAYVASIAEKIDTPVQNKIIVVKNGQEVVHQEGVSGQKLDQAAVIQSLRAILQEESEPNQSLAVQTIEPATIRPVTYHYCVTSNQVDSSRLGHFSQKIAATLADARGWGLGGMILFQEVSSGCAFNLVLAKATTLPSYSSYCSVDWSCRVGSNVIINENNWLNGTASWNAAGGSMDDYQSMVINHEVGHWLGFDDNQWVCPGLGQPAPMMQQQSISLRGCNFNPWPTPYELDALRALKGL